MSNLPKGWKDLKLGDICNFYLGLTYTPTYVDKGIPFLSVKDLKNNQISFENTKYISEEEFENSTSNAKPQKGDIVFGRVGTLGNPVIVDFDIPFCIFVSLGFIRVHDNIFNEFIKHWISSDYFMNQVDSQVSGSAQKNLNVGWLKNFKLFLPPIEEQKKIADILSTVDKKIAFVEENINATEELKKGLMQKLLTEGIGHTEFKDSELGRIPESWEVDTISSISKNFDGMRVPIKSEERNERKGIYPYYGAQGIIDYIDNYIFNGTYLLVAEDGENVRSQKYNIAFVVEGEFWVNNHAHILQTNINIDINYIASVLNYMDITKYVTGTGQPKLNKAQLQSIKLLIPPFEEQKQIAEIFSAVDKKLENLKEKKQSFEELKKGLMQKLLTGEVRV